MAGTTLLEVDAAGFDVAAKTLLPPIPDAMAQAQLELAVPIRFRLR